MIEKRKEPRSYLIRTSNGLVLRRNRRHLYNSTGSNQLSDCDLDDDNLSKDQPPQKVPIAMGAQQDDRHVQEAQPYRTQSGRASRKPARYQAK